MKTIVAALDLFAGEIVGPEDVTLTERVQDSLCQFVDEGSSVEDVLRAMLLVFYNNRGVWK